MNKEFLKKDEEELQEYLQFRRRGSKIEVKKGKGSEYNRAKAKSRNRKKGEREDFDD